MADQGNESITTGSSDLLGTVIDGRIAVLSLNRPKRRNALSAGVYQGFETALPQIAANGSIRALVITGEGGAFCAGGDVKAMNERNQQASSSAKGSDGTAARVADLQERQRGLSLALRQLPQPVVAVLSGPAAGAGLSIALAADLRLATRSAILVTAFSSVGGSGDFGGSWLLPQLIGESQAKELYFLSPRVSADEALAYGLVNAVFDDDVFDEEWRQYVNTLADRAPLALREMKRNINRAAHVSFDEALEAEAVAMVETMATEDHKEAAAAFVDKRSPVFHGR